MVSKMHHLSMPNTNETITGGRTLQLSKYDKVFLLAFFGKTGKSSKLCYRLHEIKIPQVTRYFKYQIKRPQKKVRKPHKVITDDTTIKITTRTLSTELSCPICLDLLTSTMTTKVVSIF
jgi:hypothetical protein